MPAPRRSFARHLFARPHPSRRRAVRHATLLGLGLLALVFVFAGCDSDDLGNGVVDTGVRVQNFSLADEDSRGGFLFSRDFSVSELEVQYEGDLSILTAAAVDDGIVLLYASDRTGSSGLDGLVRDGWTPLPLALGVDLDADLSVDFTLTTTYTYDVGRLFVNIIASNDFSNEEFAISDDVIASLESIDFKLVTLPGGGLNRSAVDYSDYEAVKRAYNLPD